MKEKNKILALIMGIGSILTGLIPIIPNSKNNKKDNYIKLD